jgi:hypothetical protein
VGELRQASEGRGLSCSSGDDGDGPGGGHRSFVSRCRCRRVVVVSVLVIGSLLVAVVLSVVVGAERPYPGVALGSGLLLELERAVAVWAVVLLALVVGDQALRGRLPDEIGGRGVRYAAQEQLDALAGETAEVSSDAADRLGALEKAVEQLRQGQASA